jgi:hypothetical protein
MCRLSTSILGGMERSGPSPNNRQIFRILVLTRSTSSTCRTERAAADSKANNHGEVVLLRGATPVLAAPKFTSVVVVER